MTDGGGEQGLYTSSGHSLNDKQQKLVERVR